MWCVFDSSFEFNWCVASFASESEARYFRDAYLANNPGFCDDWVWLRFFPDAVGPDFVDSQAWDSSWSW